MLNFHKKNKTLVESFLFSNEIELPIPIKRVKVKVYRHFIDSVIQFKMIID